MFPSQLLALRLRRVGAAGRAADLATAPRILCAIAVD